MKNLYLIFLCMLTTFIGNAQSQMDLPVSFDDTATVNYGLIDFGGNASSIVVDPAGGPNLVVESVKGATAQLWAGTTLDAGTPKGFASAIPFTASATTMTVRVYSPDAGIPVRLKVEDKTAPTLSVETEAMTTVANAWEVLTFDFSNEAPGTAALNLGTTYDLASIFFNFGTDGMTAGQKTYYWDDVEFGAGMTNPPSLSQMDLPVSFDDTATVNYGLIDFGGNASSIVVDPAGGPNLVVESVKGATAQLWAGTTLDAGTPNGFANAIPFTASATTMTVRVYSPDAGIPVRLKVEDKTAPTLSVETEAMTTVANAWEVLTFDFSNEAPGTAALNLGTTYDLASIFFNFGTDGMTAGQKTYYWDDVEFGAGMTNPPSLSQMDLPVSFDDTATVNYVFEDFGGNASLWIIDPTDPNNVVASTTKDVSAQTWAGTSLDESPGATHVGFVNSIPFTATETTMSVRVWSPVAGIPVRLKVESSIDNTISVETEATVSAANTWETLVFDFSNESPGTAAFNLASTYDLASIFFDFGTDGATVGSSRTYLWDDVEFGGSVVDPCDGVVADINIFDDFECQSNISYRFANATWTPNVSNPNPSGVNTSTLVGEFIHWGANTDGAFGDSLNLGPVSLATNNQLKIDVHTNATAIPITIVLQDLAGNDIVAATMSNTVTGAWETLNFDFKDASDADNVARIIFVVNPGAIIQDTVYFDNIRLDGFVSDPCETEVPNKDILEDFDCQRNIDYQFIEGGFASVANPDIAGINTSDNVGQYTRNNTVADAFGGDFILAPLDFASNNQIKMNIWDANAPSEVTMVLQDASGADLGSAVAMSSTANVWEDINFDFSFVPDVAGVSKVVILFDAGAQMDSNQVYFFDNLRLEGYITSINEINSKAIAVFPNPTEETLNIDVSSLDSESLTISVLSLEGKLLKENRIKNQGDIAQVDVSQLNTGFYILQVATANKKHLLKFIKK